MGRKKITDGTKLKYVQLPIAERDLKKLGQTMLENEFKKMVVKLLHNLEKGKAPNQTNLIDVIAEIEKENK
jgi:hypothetical protein